MSKTISVIYKNSEHKSFVTAGLYLLYAVLGASGTVLSFVSCFGIGKDIWFYLIPILLTVLACSVFLFEKIYKMAMLFYSCGLLVYVLMQWKKLVGGFITTANIVIMDVNVSYQMGFEKLVYPKITNGYQEKELFLIVLTVFLTFLISFFVMGYASAVGCILTSLPFTVFGIFFDLFPKLVYMVMSVTFWIVAASLRASGRKGRRRSDAAAYNAFFVALSIMLIFFVSQKIMPGEQYNRSQMLNDVKEFFNESATKITSTIFEGEGVGENDTGMGHGEFGDEEEIHFTGHTMLEVKVPFLSQNIYLKGVEYNDYVGNGWENNTEWFESYFQDTYDSLKREMWPQNTTSTLLQSSQNALGLYNISATEYWQMVKQHTVEINNIGEQEYGFAPYGAVIEGNILRQDVLPDMKGMKNYKYDVYTADVKEFLTRVNTELIASYWEDAVSQNWESDNWYGMQEFYSMVVAEDSYAAYVRKAYTQVPQELEYLLKNYAPVTVEYNYEDTMKFVQQIQQMFLQEYAYTLAPGKVPDGRDGVEYFLTENKKGYCVYFASAATLIFRAAGIPSRYVEGYVVTPDMAKINRRETISLTRRVGDEAIEEEVEYVTVTVPDNKAHAWVEIYVAGYGWIPIEVTPGYYAANDLSNWEEESESEQETTTKQEEETKTSAKKEEEQPIKEEKNFDWKALGRMVLFLAMVAVLVAVAGMILKRWYHKGCERFLAIINEDCGVSTKQRACLAWWYMEAVMKFLKSPIPDNVSCEKQKEFLKENTEFFSKRDLDDKIDNIIKAYYGNENLTNEEMEGIAEMIVNLRKETWEALSTGRQLYFKYIKRL